MQTACCEHEAGEAKKYKERCQKLDKYLSKHVQKISKVEAQADQAIQSHCKLIVDFQAFQVRVKQEKNDLVTRITQETKTLSTQAQHTIEALQTSLAQAENTRSSLQDQISCLEGSLTSLEEENCKLRESLDLGKERICSLEDKERNQLIRMELRESQVKT